jgi:hypothetical protein
MKPSHMLPTGVVALLLVASAGCGGGGSPTASLSLGAGSTSTTTTTTMTNTTAATLDGRFQYQVFNEPNILATGVVNISAAQSGDPTDATNHLSGNIVTGPMGATTGTVSGYITGGNYTPGSTTMANVTMTFAFPSASAASPYPQTTTVSGPVSVSADPNSGSGAPMFIGTAVPTTQGAPGNTLGLDIAQFFQ